MKRMKRRRIMIRGVKERAKAQVAVVGKRVTLRVETRLRKRMMTTMRLKTSYEKYNHPLEIGYCKLNYAQGG
jgi:hypothetical protein